MEPGCLGDDDAAAAAAGTLSEAARAHAAGCARCGRLLAEVARGTLPSARGEVPLLAEGMVVGRYVIEDVLGAGAMGVVYSAHDPELDRRVALKFVRPHRNGERAAARLVIEAQALAKVSHPNVVQVYDVGVAQGRVFIALELVKGGTVRSWLTAAKRTPAEIVALYRAAGEGLHAAHRAGVVHRDFKPDNLLIDEELRVRVTDFGLAAASFDRLSEPPVVEPPERPSFRPTSLTESGMVLGTPAYMAPECRIGGRADARSDQYSFGVALVESLVAIQAAESVPHSVQRAIDRTLEADPEKRFPSMAALVEALAWPSAPPPRRWIAAAGAAVVVVVGLAGIAAVRARSTPPPCSGGAARFDQVIAPARLEKLGAAAEAPNVKLAAERAATATRLRTLLDAYRRDWIGVYGEACEATRVRGDQSEDMMDLKMSCLDARLSGAEAFVSLLERGDPTVAEKLSTREPLEPVAACGDRAALLQRAPRPKDAAVRAKIQGVADRVARARALDKGGDYKAARSEDTAAVAEARAAGYGPTLAEALAALALAEEHDSDSTAAERDATEAALVAEASHHDRVAAGARIGLARIVGGTQERATEGRRLADEAAAAIARVGGDARLEVDLLGVRADIAEAENKPDEEKKLLEERLALATKVHGATSLVVGGVENDLGVFLMSQGQFDESLVHFGRADEIERPLGAHHPLVLKIRFNRALVLSQLLRVGEAKEVARGLVELEEEVVGPDHMSTGKALELYANLLLYEPATRAQAVVVAKRALAVAEKNLGPDTVELAMSRAQTGEMLIQTGGFAEAESMLAAAIGAIEKRGESRNLAQALELHGEALVGLGRLDEATAELERSLTMSKAKDFDPGAMAVVEFALARAVVKKDPKRARSLATSAEVKFAALGVADDERLAAARAWLKDHPG